MDRLAPWLRRNATLAIVVATVVLVVALRLQRSHPQPHTATEPVAARVVSPPREFLVHVAGAVKHPGVYRIGGDGRVIQVIRKAGGPTPRANLAGVNLAAPVQDGQQIVVPVRVSAAAAAASVPGGPFSLAGATVEQLDTLDGIGPTLAARIVAWRDAHGGFQSVDQLTDVPGIGSTRLEALRPHLTP